MISKERVTELTHMAIYDQHEEKPAQQSGQYYCRDYVGKEVLKSFFSGTIAFGALFGLVFLVNMDMFFERLTSSDLTMLIFELALIYVLFMALYMLITVSVYYFRFKKGRNQLREYYRRVKKINKMYEREERLKE